MGVACNISTSTYSPSDALDVEYLRDGASQALDGASGRKWAEELRFLFVDAHLNAAIKGFQTKLTGLPLGVICCLRNQIAQKWKATCQGSEAEEPNRTDMVSIIKSRSLANFRATNLTRDKIPRLEGQELQKPKTLLSTQLRVVVQMVTCRVN